MLESFSYGPTALPPTTRPGKVRGRLTTKVLWEAVDVTMKIRTQGWTALKLGNKGRVGVRNTLAPSLLPFCQNLTDTRYTAALTKSQYVWRVIRRGRTLRFQRAKGLCVQLRVCCASRVTCTAHAVPTLGADTCQQQRRASQSNRFTAVGTPGLNAASTVVCARAS